MSHHNYYCESERRKPTAAKEGKSGFEFEIENALPKNWFYDLHCKSKCCKLNKKAIVNIEI